MITYQLGHGEWRIRAVGGEDWFPTSLPGEVHVALINAGYIPDPFLGENELDVAWVAETDWEFDGQINVSEDLLSEDRVSLHFDGLDTLAVVYVNGMLVGEANNAFRNYRWDVKSFLRPGKNNIRILFYSPVNYVKSLYDAQPLPSPGESLPGGPYLRKAPCQWGWDWGPKLPPIGIWKDARLEGYSTAKLESVHVRQDHRFDESVSVSAGVTLAQWAEANLQLCLTLRDPSGNTFATTCKVLNESATAVVEIPDPLLWWPNGYGDQPLYVARVTLGTEEEAILDSRDFQLGLRSLVLQQEEDEFGESFTFVVNGVPIFAKGANWIPADSFPTRVTWEQLDQLLGDAARANHNMVRVWGGGIYESEDFYDLCDQYGILVWQDFIFSCSIYPLNVPEFVANIQQEVRDNVSRIRHRASLALWCGNNEMDLGWEAWGWDNKEFDPYRDAYREFFYETLPGWLKGIDPDTPYWYSSPSSGKPFENANSSDMGDAHYWEVWHGAKPFSAYREQFPRFMSEFGFQSLPPLKTIASYASEDHWNLTDYLIEHHQRSHYASALFMGQMALHYMMPLDFPSLVYLTMVLQSEGIRYGVEHWRRNNHRVGGTLYWQLNDCWPVASWSSMDYFGRWKALHYASRKFYAPLLLSIEENQNIGEMGIHLTNDRKHEWEGVIRWQLMRLNGDILEEGNFDIRIDALASKSVFHKKFDALSFREKRETVFVAQLFKGDHRITTRVATFVPNKHLQLVEPKLKAYLLKGEGDTYTVELEAENLARYVELSMDDADVIFSDNYFDVLPGETFQVTFNPPEGWTIDDAARSLTVFSLYDSFA